ncbi:hypothetical protein G3I60_09815 [Streptomyces sp. SID13666]|uniref:hypothetical protein n=1 Tax=Streptomyces sp. SID13666 TaxID=2706054 RepID=UPI0013BF745D|nr:hypothetical protein [Streptomyces sp. SID13666]NEA54442.1 hypothetical protein [Streptomyces sp. SID13666]
MKTQTTQEQPVELPLRLDSDPQPVPGCALCDNVAMERDRAKANGDASGVSDCHVRMRRHQEGTH